MSVRERLFSERGDTLISGLLALGLVLRVASQFPGEITEL